MEIKRITQAEWLPKVSDSIYNSKYRILYGVVETPVAIVHRKTQVDEEVCQKYNYTIIESFNNGGTILSNEGDFLIAHFGQLGNNWRTHFTNYFTNWLRNKGLNVSFTENDILVDGYKVCGTCVTRYGNVDYSGVAIGLNTKLEHIKAICRKPMNKVPRGLYDYDITTEEIEQMFLEFCNTI